MDSNNPIKPTFPILIVTILILFSFIFIVLVGGIVYLVYNPNITDIPNNLLKIFVKQKVEQINHGIYLHEIQDPDKDKDGLIDYAETQIFDTDKAKNDSTGTGLSDGQYIYSVYQKAFQTGDESTLAKYRANFAIYRLMVGTSTLANNFVNVPSLDNVFNIRSIETYNFYVGMPDDVKQIVKNALDARQRGDYQTSLDLLQNALQNNPDLSVLKYHLALTYQDQKLYDKALPIYVSIVDDPIVSSPILYSDIASNYLGLGNNDKFVEFMRKSIKEFPDDLNQYIKLAVYYKSLNQLDKAKEVLNEGLKIEPRYADFYNELAVIANLQGDVQTEFSLYQKAINYDYLYSAGHYNLALLYQEIKNDLKSALVEAKIALDFDPTPSHTALVMLIYDQLGMPIESLRYENQLLTMNNIDASSYNSLGLKYLDVDNYTKAEVFFRKAIEANPVMPNPYNNLGIVLASTGRIDEAKLSYEKAIQLNPEYANAYSNLGIIYTDKKQYQTAIEMFKKAIQLNPNLFRPHQAIAYVYLILGDNTNARLSYQKAVDLGDTDPAVINKLRELNNLNK